LVAVTNDGISGFVVNPDLAQMDLMSNFVAEQRTIYITLQKAWE